MPKKIINKNLKSTTLEDQKEKLILDHLGESVIIFDKELRVTFINELARHLLGFKRGAKEVLGEDYFSVLVLKKKTGELVSPEERPMKLMLQSKQRILVTSNDNYLCERRDGTTFPIHMKVLPFYEKRNFVGGMAIFHETKKRDSQMAIDFISMASHQLRTPLAVANLYTDMLLANHLGELSAEQREAVEEISFYHDKMSSVLVEFLTAARVEMGTFTVRKEDVDLTSKVNAVLRELSAEFKHKKIDLVTEFDSDIPVVSTDPEVLKLVFHRLVDNAIKYSPELSKIVVRVETQGNEMIVSVSDQGPGISKEEEGKIFDKFYHGKHSKHESTSAVGFGLYIVKSLLDLVGSKICFESKEGEGTIFHIHIPV